MFRKILFFLMLSFLSFNYVFSVDISSCQTISSGGSYVLTQDISTTGDCLQITTGNVNLDCQGHTISGDGGNGDYGIYFDDIGDNLNISNCLIENFDIGIYSNNGDYNNYYNITIRNCDIGLDFSFSDHNNLTDIHTSNNGYGLYFDQYSSSGTSVQDSNISDYIYDISQGSITYSNVIYPFDLGGVNKKITLVNTDVVHTMSSDFTVTGDALVVYTNVTLDCQGHTLRGDGGSTDNGIILDLTGDGFNVTNCVIDNFGKGIRSYDVDNLIVDNIVVTNCNRGLELYFLNNAHFTRVNSTGNTYNLYLYASRDNYFYLNIFGNTSKVYSNSWSSYPNDFNYSVDGNNVGNYWNDLSCLASEMRGDYEVCTNPVSYTLGVNNVDNAPLASAPSFDIPEPEPALPSEGTLSNIFPFGSFISSVLSLILVMFFLF